MSDTTNSNQFVISKDGTRIAYTQTGSGPSLLLIHGTGGDHRRWALMVPHLAKEFTVYCMERRGRGLSGDGPVYDMQREYEDIQALVAALPGPVNVLAHSFAAASLLGAAHAIPNLGRIILYEPPMLHEQHSPHRVELLEQMDQALANGDREQVVVIMMRDILSVPAPIVEKTRATPAWADSVSVAHTFPRELRVSDAYGAQPQNIKAIQVPCLFLLGGNSMESFKVTTETLNAMLPDSRIVVLPGQQHSAMLTAPELLASEVIKFLKA